MPLARPQRMRFAFAGDTGVTPIAGVLVMAICKVHLGDVKTMFDLAGTLFTLFWILGWSLGVLILGVLAVLLLFYRESFYLDGARLVTVARLGPLRMIAEYDLAELRNLRVEPAKGGARVAQEEAESIVAAIREVMPSTAAPAAAPSVPRPAAVVEPEPPKPLPAIALVAANLVPLLGVVYAGWRLDQVMVLFWAESAIVAVHTLAKMAVVGRWLAIPMGVFFIAHFGGTRRWRASSSAGVKREGNLLCAAGSAQDRGRPRRASSRARGGGPRSVPTPVFSP